MPADTPQAAPLSVEEARIAWPKVATVVRETSSPDSPISHVVLGRDKPDSWDWPPASRTVCTLIVPQAFQESVRADERAKQATPFERGIELGRAHRPTPDDGGMTGAWIVVCQSDGRVMGDDTTHARAVELLTDCREANPDLTFAIYVTSRPPVSAEAREALRDAVDNDTRNLSLNGVRWVFVREDHAREILAALEGTP